MKKTPIVILGLCLLIAAFASCKKKNNPSATDNIVGKWKVTEDAIDTNGNGKIDANEVFTDTGNANRAIIFNANGTVTETYMGVTIGQGSWAFENNNAYLRIADTGNGGSVTHEHIDNLTSSAMTLKDTTGGIAVWTVFAKQ